MSAVDYSEVGQRNREVHQNRDARVRKPALRRACAVLYQANPRQQHSKPRVPGIKVEFGSGMGNIRNNL